MNYKIVPVKNVIHLSEAGDALINRPPGLPGMGLIHGPTGYGKSTAADWLVNKINGVYVRALASWTPQSMLRAILRELDVEPKGTCADLVGVIVEKLAQSGKPLFVDEADYLVESKRMTETLRDLHDLSTSPVILIGMGGIERKLKQREQLSGRVAESVEFMPCDLEDARLLADGLCEVSVEDDLLEKLLRAAQGSARLIVVGLSHIEREAKARGKAKIKKVDWKRPDFFFGQPPKTRSIPQKMAAMG